ncbi:Arc family DNA-binding protein [Escherichia coli]|uniref:Arc family DNA-binding protein n=1 Tax=Escherichia coli TaxID=562 RepID=UPI0024C452DE|nr:Arc family DNA-binding protein [Escherichia coli]
MAEKQVKDYDKFNLRFPDGMREVIAERAKRNGRSMNSEIVEIISNAISQPALAQEGIDYLLNLTAPGEIEKIPPEERDRIHDLLVGAASIMAQQLESQSYDLRRILYLISQESPLFQDIKPT